MEQMKNLTNPESVIREKLEQIKEVPPRNPQVAARARARFLAEAVAASEARRQRGWNFIFRKQQFAMNVVVTLLVIAGLFIGGGTTVKAAQDDLPNEPLYAIKTLSEDVSLQFQKDPEAKVERLMELAQTRVQEMDRLIASGQTPPDQVRVRLEQHLEQTLAVSSNMDDAALDRALPQLRDQLQQRDRDMQRLQAHAAQNAQPILNRTRTMLQTQLAVVGNGLQDHEMFRSAVRNGLVYEQTQTPPALGSSTPSTPPEEPSGQATPPPGNPGNGNGLGPTTDPAEPAVEVTATPNNNGTGTNPGNNSGGNNKDKDKDPKDKDPKDKDPKDKDPKK